MNNRFRRAAAVIAAFTMLTGLYAPPVLAISVDGYSDIIIEEGFENGSVPSTMYYKTDAGARPVRVDTSPIEAETHGKAAMIPTMGDNGRIDHFLRNQYNLVNGKYTAEMLTGEQLERFQKAKFTCDVMVGELTPFNLSLVMHESLSSRPMYSLAVFKDDGTFSVVGKGDLVYEANTWYSFTFYVDFANKTVTTYLNGGLVQERAPAESMKGSYALSFGPQLPYSNADTYVYVDGYSYSVPADPAVEATVPASGYADFPVLDGEAEFLFNHYLSETTPADITVTDGSGDPVDGASVGISGNRLAVRLEERLAFDTDYIITVNAGVADSNGKLSQEAVSLAVHTMQEALYASKPVFTGTAGDGGLSVSAVAGNPLDEPQEAVLVIAAYDDAGNMTASQTAAAVLEGHSETTLTADLEWEGSEAVTACAFATDRVGLPLRPDVAVWNEDSASESALVLASGAAEVAVSDFTVDGDTITFAGSVSPAGQRLLLASVLGPEGPVLYLPLHSDDTGAFSYFGTLPAASEGSYRLMVAGREMETAVQEGFYISEQSKETLLTNINQAKSAADVEELLADYHIKLGLEASYFCENTYQTLYEQQPFETFDQIKEMMIVAQILLERVNTTGWSDLSPVLTEYAGILLCGQPDVSYYQGLSGNNQNRVNQNLVKQRPFADFLELRTAFAKAVDEYQESLRQNSRPGGGNSGGGGGGSSGGSSFGIGGGANVAYDGGKKELQAEQPDQPQQAEQVEVSFTDLAQAAWAEDSILFLAHKGIVSGNGNGQFRPLDAISREEFVKLLLGAVGMELSETPSGFLDTEKGAWYEPYLSAARAAGIVSGDDTGAFGVGQAITRQDMAVMAYRALQAVDIAPQAAEDTLFTDDESISVYAREAVYALRSIGILNGMEDGRFAPHDSASRAQAAKVASGLLWLKERGDVQ